MSLTPNDLHQIRLLFREEFAEQFPIHFRKHFDESFAQSFNAAFGPAFDQKLKENLPMISNYVTSNLMPVLANMATKQDLADLRDEFNIKFATKEQVAEVQDAVVAISKKLDMDLIMLKPQVQRHDREIKTLQRRSNLQSRFRALFP